MYHNRVDAPSKIVKEMLKFDPEQFKMHEAQLADTIDGLLNNNNEEVKIFNLERCSS